MGICHRRYSCLAWFWCHQQRRHQNGYQLQFHLDLCQNAYWNWRCCKNVDILYIFGSMPLLLLSWYDCYWGGSTKKRRGSQFLVLLSECILQYQYSELRIWFIFALLPESVDYKMGMIGGAEKRRKRRRGGGSEVKVRGVANAGTGVPASQGARPGVSSSSALCSTSPSVTCTFSSHFHSPCKKRL